MILSQCYYKSSQFDSSCIIDLYESDNEADNDGFLTFWVGWLKRWNNPVLDPLAVLHLENLLYVLLEYFFPS